MKTVLPTRLSEHLLHEARRFQGFPDRQSRTRPNLAAQALFDKIGEALITERETFMASKSLLQHADPARLPVVFDELYSRRLLGLVPEIVERTLRLRDVTLEKVPSGQLLTYLKEASRTYAMGFFAASVTLSRSAVEAALRPLAAKNFGKAAADHFDLLELINRSLGSDKVMRERAHHVRTIGNDVVHDGRPVNAEETLSVLEAARAIVARVASR